MKSENPGRKTREFPAGIFLLSRAKGIYFFTDQKNTKYLENGKNSRLSNLKQGYIIKK